MSGLRLASGAAWHGLRRSGWHGAASSGARRCTVSGRLTIAETFTNERLNMIPVRRDRFRAAPAAPVSGAGPEYATSRATRPAASTSRRCSSPVPRGQRRRTRAGYLPGNLAPAAGADPAGFRPRTGGSTGGAGSVLGLAGRPKTRRPTARGSASRPRPRKPGNFFGRASRAERHGNPFIFRCVLSMVWGSVIVGLVREIMD